MWEKLQAKYVMPPSSQLPAYQRQGSILSGPASDGSGHHTGQAGLSPGGSAAQGAPTEGVSNTSAPASLSSTAVVGGAAAQDEAAPGIALSSPQPNTGLLSRLLSKMAAAKQRRQEQQRGQE